MATPEKTSPSSRPGEQALGDAIALFESILQSMPDDRVSLDALAMAYEQLGDAARSRSHLKRLAEVVLREKDREAAELVVGRVKRHADPEMEALARALEELQAVALPVAAPAAPKPAAAKPGEAEPVSDVALRRQILQREMSLAWDLLQASELNQDEYAQIVQDLTELSSNDRVKTISVLHALADRSYPGLDHVLTHLMRRSGRPCLPLASFDPQEAAYSVLPLPYMIQQGVLPFDRIGSDLLVATLNPGDMDLHQDVAARSGCGCHFFLVSPGDFDTALLLVRKRLETKA